MLLALVVAAAPLQLTVGAQTLLEAPGVSEASSSAPTRLAVHLVDGRVLLVALAPGPAVVRYRTAQGKAASRQVEVQPFDGDAKLRATHALLKDAPNAVVWLEGTCAAIDCTGCAPAEEAVASQVRALEGCAQLVDVISAGDPDACFQAAVETLDDGAPALTVHRVGRRVIVTGEARSADDRARLAKLVARCPSVRLGVLGR